MKFNMNKYFFKRSLLLIRDELNKFAVNRIFNSIGSNIFIEFGKNINISLSPEKEDFRKEWVIWISHASWRITKKEMFIVGSDDSDISSKLQILHGKRFQAYKIISNFLDIKFEFEEGVELTTFFNKMVDDQWIVFLPNKTEIAIECSTLEEINNINSLSEGLVTPELYQPLTLSFEGTKVKSVINKEYDLPSFTLQNNEIINLNMSAWRLEKDGKYFIGALDQDKTAHKEKLLELIGQPLLSILIANSGMDAKIQFGKNYCLKMFSSSREKNPLEIFLDNNTVYRSNISIE